MTKLNRFFKGILESDLYFFLFISITTFLLYKNVIIADTVLSYDDGVLLSSLAKVDGISHYFKSIFNGNVLDFQPVRDLSYFLDFKIKSIFPSYSFHFSNTVIWIAICCLVRKIFNKQFSHNIYLTGLIVILYAVSPISASSVAWIAARKHLLSTLFILLSTYIVLKNDQKINLQSTLIIILCYFLSCFSQPINSMWVIWLIYFLYSSEQLKRSKLLVVSSALVCFTSIAVNFYYYKFLYVQTISSMSKFMNYKTLDLGDPLLALGRYFYQCLNPFAALPTTHYPGSWENLMGLLLLVIFLAFSFKKIKNENEKLLSPILYFFFPLILVTVNMTNIFSSDTYLLNSSVGFYWCCLILLDKVKNQKALTSVLAIYALAVSLYSYQYIQIFTNENELWFYSQKKEAAPQTTVIASSILVKQKKFRESYILIQELQDRWPNQPYLPQLIAENVFSNPEIDNQLKIKSLNEITPPMPSTYFYLSILYAYNNDVAGLKNVLFKYFEEPEKFNMEFRGNEEKIIAIFHYTCEHFKLEKCQEHIDAFKAKALKSDWDLNLIKQYKEQLDKQPNFQINI